MGTRRWILWQGLIAPSMERFIVGAASSGIELSGLILQAHEEAPSTNTLPIRRLGLRWRIQDGQRRVASIFDGLVLQYGANWKAVAASGQFDILH
jgi:hypothetical protein